ncbi:efflux RND transporter periplasmic adaptor subunit [Neolewinella persica]|uniref:efflux RND transporter periplasmic adaptor subunit n=1 Tax=Neolewinella persica TaxID=70998 RepID=UPI00036E3CB8|nr:efflux RND transporter periplasmic adaptor subunit [Neolewinella persica]
MKYFFLLPIFALSFSACQQDAPAETPMEQTVATAPNKAVTTGPVERRMISKSIACTGTIEIPPSDRISVHSRTSGQVSGLRLIPGDYVRKGGLLCRISNPALIPLQRQLLETRASLATARQTLERQRILSAGEATTAAALQDSEGRVALLTATYNGLKSELQQYGIGVDALENEGTFQSSVSIYAQAAGYIHEVTVNEGRMVSPTDQLMEIAGTEHLHLELMVPSQQIGRLKKGQTVNYTLPFESETGTATIEKINPMVNDASATLQVHCHFNGKDNEKLLPGLFVNATVLTGTQEVYGLPLDAVVKEGQTYFAFQFRDGTHEKMALHDAEVNGDFVTFSNAPDGDWVTGGAYYLGEGE